MYEERNVNIVIFRVHSRKQGTPRPTHQGLHMKFLGNGETLTRKNILN